MNQSPNLLNRIILSSSRSKKRLLMILGDLIAFPLALWSAYALRLSDLWASDYLEPAALLFTILPFMGVLILGYQGLYRAVIRYLSVRAVFQVLKGVLAAALSIYLIAYAFDLSPFPRSVPIIFALVAMLYVGGSRLLVRSYYYWLITNYVQTEPVIIYGAGTTGAKLPSALKGGGIYSPVCFLDDDARLKNSSVSGLQVYGFDDLNTLLEVHAVKTVLLAIPSASKQQRKHLIEKLVALDLKVLTVPTMSDIISGVSDSTIREIDVADLLGRDAVAPIPDLLSKSIFDKNVLVTGAGGSIGSEIATQALKNGARVLVILDSNELALYTIEQSLLNHFKNQQNTGIEIIPILGSVLDKKLLASLLQRFGIQTVYHAAAYKHVPLVEQNIINGVRNNVFGTKSVVDASIKAGIERFILVSTDKAVRPTNIMGATKRLAELIVQSSANAQHKTIVSMVRFGNVLGSSGSVVPHFKMQIADGGPVTLTHPEINRYFMTIPEAASLVIQAGSMSEGGEVFVLDMGEPVKIIDLAKNMIKLSGYTVKDSENSEGDIAIEITGLRPGEKLYEELLICGNEEATIHPKIMKANEAFLNQDELEASLENLSAAIEAYDSKLAKETLISTIKEYQASDRNVDWLK